MAPERQVLRIGCKSRAAVIVITLEASGSWDKKSEKTVQNQIFPFVFSWQNGVTEAALQVNFATSSCS